MVQSRQGVHNKIANELLPTSATQGSPEIIQTRQPSYTYNVEFEADGQINGFAALEADDRIISVTGFEFSHDDGDVFARFDVETIFGTIENITKGVSV